MYPAYYENARKCKESVMKINSNRTDFVTDGIDNILSQQTHVVQVSLLFKSVVVDYKNAFELQAKDHSSHVLLVAKSPEEKSNWMAALISLQTRR